MKKIVKYFLIILTSALVGLGIEKDTAYSLSMTIGAIEDAGQWPGQSAFLRFRFNDPNPEYRDINTTDVPSQWTSKQQVIEYADSNGIPSGWVLESAGNIWSPDTMAGDALDQLNAGIYRISVVSGAFMYDSFDWSPYADKWWWQLHIQARKVIQNDVLLDYADYILGSTNPYDTAELALQASLGDYLDISLAEGGSLIFWIYDNPNTIDNLGNLTFNIIPIPEPSTLILIGTGLPFLFRRFRRLLFITQH